MLWGEGWLFAMVSEGRGQRVPSRGSLALSAQQRRTDDLDHDVFPICFLVVALRDVADVGAAVLQLRVLDDEDGADIVGGPRQEVGHWLHSLPRLQTGTGDTVWEVKSVLCH